MDVLDDCDGIVAVLLLDDPNVKAPVGPGGTLLVKLFPNNGGAVVFPNNGAADGVTVEDATIELPNSGGAEGVDDDVGGTNEGALETLSG